jgi:hypothetical protein
MKKKILLGLGGLLLVFVAFFAYRISTTGKASPAATATLQQDALRAKVSYGRPYKKNRLIFGEKEAGALVPFGRYWRLGANAATEVTFDQDVLFAGQPVRAGSYRMYAIPGAASWKVILNSQLGRWGAWEPNHDKDVLSVEVPVESQPTSTEQFTIDFSTGAQPGAGTTLDFIWDTTRVRVPLAPQKS